jgi:pilus assembly protein CpaB
MSMFRALVLLIALGAGGLAAYLATNMRPASTPTTEVVELAPQIRSMDVLVASRDIKPGAALSRQNVRWLAWPEEGVSSTFITRQSRPEAVSEVEGAVVRSQFYEGEPIREGKLARVESGFLSAILQAGRRAAAVRVTAQSTAGGFILPNDRVDVIHTVATEGANVSRTILRNIRVLAIDQTVEERDGESVVVGRTATLELDPAQVETLASAEATGTVTLALRSMADAGEVDEDQRSGMVRIFRSGRSQVVNTQ